MMRWHASVPIVLLLFATVVVAAQVPDRALVEALRNIYQLRDYSAFDWIGGRYDRGTLTLQGMVRTPRLKEAAEAAARKTSGVEEVVNELEVLPAHAGDDELRVRVYANIYGSSALERYAPGGQLSGAAVNELYETARFGLDGTDVGRGPHPIHILVSSGRVILRGQVRTTGDRQIAEATTRTTSGVLSVVNELRVPKQ
jgi:osmotically-inducible protein OsmY